ncbi:hypothetical protein [Paenibacillus sp. RC67]|uniref:hypothetical protein n=1 Tax=Paenibacillus sp. RC67 TaxID=3039392 RepID=UPI0024AD6D7D|nr:hypothetical protein [Paenibacillus sp. RC67]
MNRYIQMVLKIDYHKLRKESVRFLANYSNGYDSAMTWKQTAAAAASFFVKVPLGLHRYFATGWNLIGSGFLAVSLVATTM